MAAGLPIATFEGSAGPVRHEVSGLRVPDGDTAAMAAALERLLTDRALARTLGAPRGSTYGGSSPGTSGGPGRGSLPRCDRGEAR